MALHFNPILWFVCKLCRKSFSDTDKLNAHKLENHLLEIKNVKCIVFEEQLLDHEWIPSPPESNEDDLTDDDNNPLAELKSEHQEQIEFQNPYVPLKRLNVDELISENSSYAFKIGIAESQSQVGQNCNLGHTDTNRKILSKRQQNFDSEVSPYSPLPLKQRKTNSDEDDDDDDVQKTKIRELLSNVVLIKSEPCDDADDQACLESQDLPISILSTYSLPATSSFSTGASSKTNAAKGNASFSSLQEQPHQLPLHGNAARVLPGPSDLTVSNFNIPNIPFTMPPITLLQPQQTYPDPDSLEIPGQHLQVERNSRYCLENTIQNVSRINFTSNITTGPSNTPEPEPAPETASVKMEFIDYDDLIPNQNVKKASSDQEQPEQILNVIHQRQKLLIVCQICNASFDAQTKLNRHMRCHSNYRAFECPHCGDAFKSKSNLRSHSIAFHDQVTASKCQFCGKCFAARDALISHEAGHTGVWPFKCDFPNCAIAFKSKTGWLSHKRVVHGKELGLQQFVCPTCGKIFGQRKHLVSHNRDKHTNTAVQILS